MPHHPVFELNLRKWNEGSNRLVSCLQLCYFQHQQLLFERLHRIEAASRFGDSSFTCSIQKPSFSDCACIPFF
jgi:hypothetical protein